MIFGIKEHFYNFDPYSVLLSIAAIIPVLLKTGFVLQGHICDWFLVLCIKLYIHDAVLFKLIKCKWFILCNFLHSGIILLLSIKVH